VAPPHLPQARDLDASWCPPEDQALPDLEVCVVEGPTADEGRWAGLIQLLLSVEVPETEGPEAA
jgi:hypothetical protein